MGGGGSKAAKVMKINGEFFKLRTPAKVFDVIKDYPNYVLLDSEEFLRFNLRARPLDSDDELKPKRIYLLVELPKFPSPIRRVRSSVNANRVNLMKMTHRSVSDLSILTRSTVSTDSDDSGSIDSPGGPTRVKMRLPKVQVERIMKESGDEVEIGQKILRLCLEEPAAKNGGAVAMPVAYNGRARGEERESVEAAAVAQHRRLNTRTRTTCIPYGTNRRKYEKITP